MKLDKFTTLCALVVVLHASGGVAGQEQLLDDFSAGNDSNWTRVDKLMAAGLGPTLYNVVGGRYQISSLIPLPAVAATVGTGSIWTASVADASFSHGAFWATVRMNTAATNIMVVSRFNPNTFSGYAYAINNVENSLVLTRFDNGVQVMAATVSTPYNFVENTDYILAPTFVGAHHKLWVFEVGSILSGVRIELNDSTYSSGAVGVAVYNEPMTMGGVGGQLSGSFDDVYFAPGSPTLALTQAAPGAGVVISNTHLLPYREYYNVFSFEPCALLGTGPYLGLCATNLTFLVSQILLPVGSPPFHFSPTDYSPISFGPINGLSPGLTVEGVCFDFTSGRMNRESAVERLVIQ